MSGESPERAALAPPSEVKINPAVRDKAGRFVKGSSGNPSGMPAKVPEVREQCRLRTASDMERLDTMIANSKDEWLVLEAIKLRLQYAWGKPVTIAGPALQVNVGAPGTAVSVHSEDLYRQAMAPDADLDTILAVYDERRRLPDPERRGEVIDAESVQDTSTTEPAA